MCLKVQGEGKVTVQLSEEEFVLVNESTAKLALNLESVIVGTSRLRSRVSPKTSDVWDFPTVSTVQHH
jgi:hypothetical protein